LFNCVSYLQLTKNIILTFFIFYFTENKITTFLTSLDNKLLVGGLFCDLTKVFRCVKHDKLLAQLEYYGINGKASDLIKSYVMTDAKE